MPKKKKSKAQKRMNKSRRTIILNIDTDALGESFCNIVSGIWAEVCRINDADSQDIDMLRAIVNHCETGWNTAVVCDTLDEAKQYIDEILGEEYPEEATPVLEMIKLAAMLKFQVCPEDRVLVMESDVIIEDNEPAISVVFDLEAAEERAREMAADVPTMNEILDQNAIQRAVDGLPPEQVEAALQKEIQRQIELHNNTPRADLGGISPSEAYRRKNKS